MRPSEASGHVWHTFSIRKLVWLLDKLQYGERKRDVVYNKGTLIIVKHYQLNYSVHPDVI